MYDRDFFKSTFGKAACGCVAVMAVFALTSQLQSGPQYAATAAAIDVSPGIFQMIDLA